MLNWIKNLFASKTEVVTPTTPVELNTEKNWPFPTADKVEPKKKAKKTSSKKADNKIDLDSMNKTQLLEEARKRGIAANASLKKNDIINRIKNG